MNRIDRLKEDKLREMKEDLNVVTGEELKKVINDYIDTAFQYGYELGHDIGYDDGWRDKTDNDSSDMPDFLEDDDDVYLDELPELKGHKL
jgi:hypothetical protein